MKRFLSVLALFAMTAFAQAQEKNPQVVAKTSKGDITIELDAARAPITVKNFLTYVDNKHYDGTVFHRVIKDFMIQGGGMEPGMKEKPTGEGIKNESSNGLANNRGTIAMARTSDPDSATAQFFVNVKDNTFLNGSQTRPGYTVFGQVVDGMDVVDAIRGVNTGNRGGHDDVPLDDIVIRSIRRK